MVAMNDQRGGERAPASRTYSTIASTPPGTSTRRARVNSGRSAVRCRRRDDRAAALSRTDRFAGAVEKAMVSASSLGDRLRAHQGSDPDDARIEERGAEPAGEPRCRCDIEHEAAADISARFR
jgi:hypothetical protein